MTATVQWVPYGRPAAEALRDAVGAAKHGDPLAPVTVVVPSNHVGVAARRLLASGALGEVSPGRAGLAAVTFLTPYRLADLLGTAPLAGAGRRPVSTPLIAAALRTALRDRPGVFAPVASHPATESALVAAYRELRDLSPDALERLASCSRRSADVVRLHGEARALLRGAWYDEEDLIVTAVGELGRADLTTMLGRVVVHLPQRLSRHSGWLLSEIAGRSGIAVVAGTTGDPGADREVERSVAALGADAGTRPAVDPMASVQPLRTRIVTVSDSEEEVRVAGRAVIDATRAGVPLDRMAILYASPEPYGRLVHEHLGSLGVEVNGASAVPLTARVAGRTLLQFLALSEVDFRRQDVFAFLSTAPLHDDGRRVPVAEWERISRDAGIVAGRDHWDRRLAEYAASADSRAARAEAEHPDAPSWKAERDRRTARRSRRLRSFVLLMMDALAEASASARPWAQRARWARSTLDGLLGGEAGRRGWPPAERAAAERVMAAVDRLAPLDGVEPAVDLAVFSRTLRIELDADLGRVGRMGDGVLVGPVSMGIGLQPDLVIVLGMAEGVFPAPTRDDSLLPDRERGSTDGQLPLRSARVDTEHRQLLAALAGAPSQLLGVPRGDLRRSSDRVPSRWVLEVAERLAGVPVSSRELLASSWPWLVAEASFDAGVRHVAFPAGEQDYRLRTLVAGASLDDAVYRAGRAMVRGRRSGSFTRFDGNLSGLAVPSPTSRPTSATRLQSWATCPFAYFMRSVLGVEAVEQPEDQLAITSRDRGSLVHEVLERFIARVLSRPPGERPAPGQPWSAEDRRLLRALGDLVCEEFAARGLTGRPLLWRRDRARILADLSRIADMDDELRRARQSEPIAAELPFGFDDSTLGPVTVDLPDGRPLQFHGMADRVDSGPEGSLLVIDYKTGSPDGFSTLSEAEPDAQGQQLQLPIYAEAARLLPGRSGAEVRAEYWFVSSRGKYRSLGLCITPEVLGRVSGTLGRIVEGVERGLFPNYPRGAASTPWVTCDYCDPDGLGGAELRSAWERKRGDHALAPFRTLAEPDPDPGAGSPGGCAADG